MTWSTHHLLFFNIAITYPSFPEALGDTNLRWSLPERTWRMWTPTLHQAHAGSIRLDLRKRNQDIDTRKLLGSVLPMMHMHPGEQIHRIT